MKHWIKLTPRDTVFTDCLAFLTTDNYYNPTDDIQMLNVGLCSIYKQPALAQLMMGLACLDLVWLDALGKNVGI